jgi:hypothetical protein
MTLYMSELRHLPQKTGDFHDRTHERLEREALLTNKDLSHESFIKITPHRGW